MASIIFSPNFLSGTTSSVQGFMVNLFNQSVTINNTDPNGPDIGFFSAGNPFAFQTFGNVGLMRVMSGTRPTNIETLTSTTPPAGTAVLWQAYATSVWSPTGNNWLTDPTSLTSVFVSALAIGTASWFWLCTATAGNPSGGGMVYPDPSTVYHNITGTIGLVGSGADMEMVNTTITTGQLVRVLNVSIGMPTTFSS